MQKLLKSSHRDWVLFVLTIVLFQFIVNLSIMLNISVVRQFLCFIYLTLVPGIILVKMFRIRNLDFVEKFLFSIGLSIAFVTFLGLLLNQVELSTLTFLFAMNSVVLFLCVFSYFIDKNVQGNKRKLNFSNPLWILTASLPLLAILGTTLVNLNGNNVILLLMIAVIALTVLISSIRDRTNWPLILLMITIAILFHVSLISNHIVGFDVHPGYHVFKITQINGRWNPVINETDPVIPRTNQMLSITILPTVYSNILNLEGTWIFKIVYPLILALVPVGLYQLYQRSVKKKAAFVATFVVLADITFLQELPGLPAQIISEFFLVLSLLVLFHQKVSANKKIILFAIFSAGMIVSHYGISYVFMFLVLIAWFSLFLRKKWSTIKSAYIILFFVMAFSWYIYTSGSASFTSLLDMGEHIYTSFWTELLNPLSRSEHALVAIGAGEPAVSIGHWLGRVFHYIFQFFIVLGFINVVLGRNVDCTFDHAYVAQSLAMLVFLLLPLVVPSFNLLNMPRMYHVSLLFLSPFGIVGGKSFFSSFSKLRRGPLPFGLTLIVVVSLFLFETGFIYEISGDVSYSIPLSKYRMDRVTVYGRGYLTESMDVFSAEWLHSNIALTANTQMYADIVSVNQPLTSYGVFPRDHSEILSNVTSFDGSNAYVYLRNFNTFDGKFLGQGWRVWNTSDVSPRFEALDKIYTNGGSEVFLVLNKTSQ